MAPQQLRHTEQRVDGRKALEFLVKAANLHRFEVTRPSPRSSRADGSEPDARREKATSAKARRARREAEGARR
ncbi:hypothetical protein BE11_19840 [Sorangium cellulosum]|nr:hypothetical protein BE11_19840 [Sorangium cellulosum]